MEDSLDGGHSKGHERLHQMAQDQPCSPAWPNGVGKLTRNNGARDEQTQAHADSGKAEQVTAESSETDGQDYRVAGLIRRKALKVWIADGILDAGGECEDEELSFNEDVDTDGGGEILA